MKATTAEKIVAKAGRSITVARANSWTGSKDSCFRSGVDASKKWACSVFDPHFKAIVEPANHPRISIPADGALANLSNTQQFHRLGDQL